MTLSKNMFENIVGNGDAGIQHFLVFPQCFPPYILDRSNHLSNLYFVVC